MVRPAAAEQGIPRLRDVSARVRAAAERQRARGDQPGVLRSGRVHGAGARVLRGRRGALEQQGLHRRGRFLRACPHPVRHCCVAEPDTHSADR